jgi:hypothetical protein
MGNNANREHLQVTNEETRGEKWEWGFGIIESFPVENHLTEVLDTTTR